jgi:YVTN family beta-propeller protein
VIDTLDKSVEAVVPTGSSPEGIVFNPRNGYIYAVSDQNANMAVIDAASNTLLRYINLPVTGRGGSIELGYNPRMNYLYATVSDADTVAVVDASSEQIVSTVPVGHSPLGVEFYPPDRNMHVANYSDGTVSVIDGTTNSIIQTIPTGVGVQWIAHDARNRTMYVTNSLQGTVSLIAGLARSAERDVPRYGVSPALPRHPPVPV